MEFAVWPGTNQAWDDIVEVARHAELSGWDRVYVADHFMPNDGAGAIDEPMLECWSVVAGLAAAVPRIGIGTLVCGNTYRHPAVLANQAATADVISGGRVILGLGAGWQVNEHDRYGIPLWSRRERMDRFEEACAVVTGLRDQAFLDFDGEHYQLTEAPMVPKPVGPMPLLIGGGGEQRTLRIAARYADEWNVWSEPDKFIQKSGVLDERCAEIDRDPATIRRSTQALLFISDDVERVRAFREQTAGRQVLAGSVAEVVDTVGRYRDAGVDELIVPDFTLGTGESRRQRLDQFWDEVAAHFRTGPFRGSEFTETSGAP